jgi:hypothetical protein
MAQHDYDLVNQSGNSFRSDLNNSLAAVRTQNSGASEPSPTFAYMTWADTTAGIFKIRNAANTGWVSVFRLDGAFSVIPPADDAVTLAKLPDGVLAASTAGRLKMADEFVTTAKLADAAVTPVKLSQPLTRTTLVTVSGTAVDFTGIPSWAKRITIMFHLVNTSGTSPVQVQLGDSGGIETTSYSGSVAAITFPNTCSYASHASGFVLPGNTAIASRTGILTIANQSVNAWVASGTFNSPAVTSMAGIVQGIKSLSATLDRVRITTVNGTDTFDAGTVNIIYEG